MTIVSRADQPVQNLEGRTLQWLAHASLGSMQTALLENTIAPEGFIPPHHHLVEELLVCLEGEGVVVLGTVTHRFVHGDTAIVEAGVVHGVRNTGTLPLRMLGFFPTAQPNTIWNAE
jgi:quercetin dioxygenase-like cupin family protein